MLFCANYMIIVVAVIIINVLNIVIKYLLKKPRRRTETSVLPFIISKTLDFGNLVIFDFKKLLYQDKNSLRLELCFNIKDRKQKDYHSFFIYHSPKVEIDSYDKNGFQVTSTATHYGTLLSIKKSK